MSWDDDDDDYGDDTWGYDGDPVHDQWVDYTTDIHEHSDYSGEKPDWEDHAEDFADDGYEPFRHSDYDRDWSRPSAFGLSSPPSPSENGGSDRKELFLKGALAASLLAAAEADDKARDESAKKDIAKSQRRVEDVKAGIAAARVQLAQTEAELEQARKKDHNRNAVVVALLCGALVMLAILLAIFI